MINYANWNTPPPPTENLCLRPYPNLRQTELTVSNGEKKLTCGLIGKQ